MATYNKYKYILDIVICANIQLKAAAKGYERQIKRIADKVL